MQRAVFIIIILSIAITALAQQPVTLGLPDPAPAWPAGGVIPPDLKTKYVFVDNEKNEFVLAYPENLGTPTFEKDGPGPMKILRFDLLRNVAPAASLSVSAVNPGKYKYAYTVGNGAGAKQTIDQFSISLPEQAADAIKPPAGWFAVIQRGKTYKLTNPDWIKTGAAAVWSFHKPEEVIQAGAKKSGFELETTLRPGFTIGYFRKAESVEVKVAASGNIPEPVKQQKDELLALEYNSKTVLMLGPKFAPDADDKTIASDFIQGITMLGRGGALNPDSEFVKSTVTELNRIVSVGPPARFTAQPRTEVETEIFNALKISLKVN